MKKILLFKVKGNQNWVGGLYYFRNIISTILHSEEIKNRYDIHILVEESNYELFRKFSEQVKVIVYKGENKLNKVINFFRLLNPSVRFIYHMGSTRYDWILGRKSVYWIPDMQYFHYPQYFSEKTILIRKKTDESISNGKGILTVNSEFVKNDFIKHFPKYKVPIAVIPFISDIEDDVLALDDKTISCVEKKFGLKHNKYFVVCNQFWQHKNHMVVLEALKYLVENFDYPVHIVFTGLPQDDRNPLYIEKINKMISSKTINNYIHITGFIGRKEQLALIKGSRALIQPSEFEGWGTAVEDASVMDKDVIMSDISVNYEKNLKNSFFFEKYNYCELANILRKLMLETRVENVQDGIKDMHRRAKIYSKGAEKIFI